MIRHAMWVWLLCAWVLWAHWGGGLIRRQDGSLYNPYAYQVVDSYETRAACESAKGESATGAGL